MKEIWERIIVEPFERFVGMIASFLPNLLVSLILIVAGIICGWLTRRVITGLLRVVKADRFFKKSGMMQALERSGLKDSPSRLIGQLAGWLVVLVFTVIALTALKVPAVENLLSQMLLYLPNLFVAVVILMIGFILGNFLQRTVLIAGVNAGVRLARTASRCVQYGVYFFATAMALEQLGIGRETVLIAFAIMFGGVVLALALAFGLGGRAIAREYLERLIKGEDEEPDDFHHL